MRYLIASTVLLLLSSDPAFALIDIIIDDSQAQFSEFRNNTLQVGTGNSSYGDGYHYIQSWGLEDENAASARVFYRLPDGLLPEGDHLYDIYAWMPDVPWQWHILDVAADGSEDFDQDIDWVGQFGTNKQWIEFDEHKPFDADLGGRWLKLGPGPQSDGTGIHLNPSKGTPYFYIGYQPFYEGLIAFDAIRIIQQPVDGDYNGDGVVNLADYTVWRDSLGEMGADLPADGNGDQTINAADYEFWKERFAANAAAATINSAVVPEPASWMAVVLFGIGLGYRGVCCKSTHRAKPGEA